MKPLLFVLLLFFSVLLPGCESEDAPAATGGKSKTELAARPWQMERLLVQVNNLSVPAYTKGATQNLADFSTYVLDLKSSGQFEQRLPDGSRMTGTWRLTQNDTTLEVTDASTKAVRGWKIQELTEQSLSFTQPIDASTTDPAERSILDRLKGLGLDVSKGVTLTVRLTP